MKHTLIIFSIVFTTYTTQAQEEKKTIDTIYYDDGTQCIVEKLSTDIDMIRKFWISARFGMNGSDFISCINTHYYQPYKFLINISHCHYSDITPRNKESIDGILSVIKFNRNKKIDLPLKYKSINRNLYLRYSYSFPITKSITIGPYAYFGYTNSIKKFNKPIIETSVIGIGVGTIFSKHIKLRCTTIENDSFKLNYKKPRIVRGQNISRVVLNVLYYPTVKVYDSYYGYPTYIGNRSNLLGIGVFMEDKRSLLSISNGSKYGLFSFHSKFGCEYSPGWYYHPTNEVSNLLKLDISVGLGYNFNLNPSLQLTVPYSS